MSKNKSKQDVALLAADLESAQLQQDATDENSKKAADDAAKERRRKRKAEATAAAAVAKNSNSQETNPAAKIGKIQHPEEDEEKDEVQDDDDAALIQIGNLPSAPVDSTALAASLAREELLKQQILQMESRMETTMNGNNDDNDDLTTNQNKRQSFIYNNDVLSLDTRVNKSTVLPFVNQFRQSEFTKEPLDLIYPDARRLISAKFIECGDCDTRGEWLLWPKKKILETLEKRYHDEKSISNIDTLTKLRDCSLKIYFGKNDSPEGQKLIMKIWKIVEEMTTEELGNYQLQKQFIKLFWDLLSNKDESKI